MLSLTGGVISGKTLCCNILRYWVLIIVLKMKGVIMSRENQQQEKHLQDEESKHMLDAYMRGIFTLIEKCEDIDYLIAVYTFASTYPDKTKK